MTGEGELYIQEDGGREMYSIFLDMEPARQRQKEDYEGMDR
jgi:hypothetical protein